MCSARMDWDPMDPQSNESVQYMSNGLGRGFGELMWVRIPAIIMIESDFTRAGKTLREQARLYESRQDFRRR